jgi:hypothetical protein
MQLSLKPWLVVATLATLAIVIIGFSASSGKSLAASSASVAWAPPDEPCLDGWSRVNSPNPNPPNPPTTLHAVAVVSATDVWAVGNTGSWSGLSPTLIEHWDGSSWTIVPSPNVGDDRNELYDIKALSANDIWAVGWAFSLGPQPPPFVIHWNGSHWSVSSTPGSGVNYGLNAIDALTPNDVWAVGEYQGGHTFTLHWNGTQWSLVPSPNYGSGDNTLDGVSAISSQDVWAVGTYAYDGHSAIMFEHWDGHHWSVIPGPSPGADSKLRKIEAVASNNIWAVGQSNNVPGLAYATLTEHWNGSQWSIVPSPNASGYQNDLDDLTVLSSNDIWAVGSSRDDGGSDMSIAEHWNGSEWSIAGRPGSPLYGYLFSVDALPGSGPYGELWAVGGYGAGETLVEHYTNPCLIPTATPTPVPPPCPGERFTDVCPPDYFYAPVLALANDGILSGYNTSPPCLNSLWIPCFNPYNSSTRGQISKVVSLAAGFNEPVSGQIFEDVPPGSTFYSYTQRMASRGIINGYPCGGPGEPCVPPGNRPYFRTNNNVTRGQLSKMTSLAFGWNEPITGQQFQDVVPGSTFYDYIGRLYMKGIINGYQCGGVGEPCVLPGNRPYFRPNNNVVRGQTAKIVQLARTQPSPTPTPTLTLTSTATTAPATATTSPTVTATVTTTVTATVSTTPDLTSTPTGSATSTVSPTAAATATLATR